MKAESDIQMMSGVIIGKNSLLPKHRSPHGGLIPLVMPSVLLLYQSTLWSKSHFIELHMMSWNNNQEFWLKIFLVLAIGLVFWFYFIFNPKSASTNKRKFDRVQRENWLHYAEIVYDRKMIFAPARPPILFRASWLCNTHCMLHLVLAKDTIRSKKESSRYSVQFRS